MSSDISSSPTWVDRAAASCSAAGLGHPLRRRITYVSIAPPLFGQFAEHTSARPDGFEKSFRSAVVVPAGRPLEGDRTVHGLRAAARARGEGDAVADARVEQFL